MRKHNHYVCGGRKKPQQQQHSTERACVQRVFYLGACNLAQAATTDRSASPRLEALDKALGELKREQAALTKQWEREREDMRRLQSIKVGRPERGERAPPAAACCSRSCLLDQSASCCAQCWMSRMCTVC